ncbi:hypothetical protein Tco_1466167 [Tanacetum coccineum]
MTSPKPSTPINERRSEETPNQNATDKSVIERHLTTLKELLMELSNRELIKPMLLDFNDDAEDTDEEVEEHGKPGRMAYANVVLDVPTDVGWQGRACCLPEALTFGVSYKKNS